MKYTRTNTNEANFFMKRALGKINRGAAKVMNAPAFQVASEGANMLQVATLPLMFMPMAGGQQQAPTEDPNSPNEQRKKQLEQQRQMQGTVSSRNGNAYNLNRYSGVDYSN